MWGYTPCSTCETGYSGAPLEHLIQAVDQIIDASLLEEFSNNIESANQGVVWDLSQLTNLTIGSVGNDGNVTVTLTFVDGSKAEAQVAMSQAQQELINSLMFDADGNSRLFQQEMHVLRVTADNQALFADFGYAVGDVIYSNSPFVVRDGQIKVTEDFFAPIRLTPSVNNGGTLETGFTSGADNTIVVGRLDLLHQAYIDAGGGNNTLEIEAKGAFAQPAQLLNIHNISIHNLPNIYDYSDWTGNDGNATIPPFDYGRGEGNLTPDDTIPQNSTIDLSRATSIEKLTLTESGYQNFGGDDYTGGTLTVAGIRNGAELHLEGGFSQSINLFYGQGISSNGLNIVLNNVDFHNNADFNIAHNANTFNINSIGGDNHLNAIKGLNAATLSTIKVSGDAHLHISGDLAGIFNNTNGRLATFDASENTGGVNINFSAAGQDRIKFVGSQADDVLTVANAVAAKIVNVTNAAGSNLYTIEAEQQINITDGTGGNTYDLTAGSAAAVVNVTAEGAGRNTLELKEAAEEATINLAGDRNVAKVVNDVDVVNVTMEGARNSLTVEGDTEEVTVVLGERGVVALEGTNEDVNVTLNGSNGLVFVETADDVVITATGGNNTFDITAEDISVTAGGSNNLVIVNGVADSSATGLNDINATNGALLDIDMVGTVVLGHPEAARSEGVTALEGSSIKATAITVLATSNLRQAELEGIQSIVLTDAAILTLTSEQFLDLGAGVFSVMNTPIAQARFQTLNLVVEGELDLTSMTAELQLLQNAGIKLNIQVEAGANLTLTAEQLHKFINDDGISFVNSGTSSEVGTVTINGAGEQFNAVNPVAGGSIDGATLTNNQNANVIINREDNGWERPTVEDADQLIITAVGNTTITSDGIDSDTQNLIINGEGTVNFEGSVKLENNFTIDFSALNGTVTNLTVEAFENVTAIRGNSSDTRINVELNDDVGDNGQGVGAVGGLVSSGVETYVVTDLNGQNREFWTCETTQDLEVLGLQGNYTNTITFGNTERGVEFLMEVAYSKSEGYVVGSLVGSFARPGATAVVNVVGVDALPAGETQKVASITLTNAVAATINVQGNTEIEELVGAGLETLTLTADGALVISGELPASLTSVDASGVAGNLTVELDDNPEAGFTFVGAAGETTLTLNDVADEEITSIEGAGGVALVIDGAADLSSTLLTNITTVTLENGAVLTLTMEQADTLGAANFIIAEGDNATLTLEGLNDQQFAKADYADGISISVTLANEDVVTLHPETDLTDIASLNIPEGTTLVLTAAQFQQLNGAGTLTGAGSVHITGLTQADVGENGQDLDLSGITATGSVTVTLAESVNLSAANISTVDTINLGDDLELTLGQISTADGVAFVGGSNTTLTFTDTQVNAPADYIDASGFGITYVKLSTLLVANENVDEILGGLPGSVTKVIYGGLGETNKIDQTATIEAAQIVGGTLGFNTLANDTEIANFTLNLLGGSQIGGLNLTTGAKVDADGNDLIRSFLQSLTINSTGTALNPVTNTTVNVIAGDITPIDGNDNDANRPNNNLLNVIINAEQALSVTGDIVFSSVVGDDSITSNDKEDAVAKLVINGTADVTLGGVNTLDADVVGLEVVNAGTGTLSITLDGAKVDATDSLSFTGSNIALDIVGTVDLSDDVITGVSSIQLANNAELTLSQAQFEALGSTNLSVINTNDQGDLVLVNFDPAVAFDATSLNDNITLTSIELSSGGTLNAATDLTDVGEIVVPEGETLTLTAEQFMQLDGTGTIMGVDADGNPSTDFNITITGLTQALIDAGFNLGGVTGQIQITLAESVNLPAVTNVLGQVPANVEFVLDTDQVLGLGHINQLSPTTTLPDNSVAGTGLTVNTVEGATGTAVELQFANNVGVNHTFDASGLSVASIRLLNDLVDGRNVELLQNIDQNITVVIYQTLDDMPGYLPGLNRAVIVEPGVTVGDWIVFNDLQDSKEIRNLTLTLQGDSTIDGDFNLSTAAKDGDLIQRYLNSLTLVSAGDTVNTITGDITAQPVAGGTFNGDPTLENNLRNVTIDAQQAFVVEGALVLSSVATAPNASATLTVSGPAAVTLGSLDASDAEVTSVTVTNNGGDLVLTNTNLATVTTLTLNGDGDITINGTVGDAALTSINAGGLEGNLTIESLDSINEDSFTFTAGEGQTNLTLDDAGLAVDGNWTFNFADAAAGSTLELGAGGWNNAGNLTINLGDNTDLLVNANTDFTNLASLSITGDGQIIVADGVTLTLTAAQASAITAAGLTVVGDGTVNITELESNVEYNFAAFDDVAGTITLATNDVTVHENTNLGEFSITLSANAATFDAAGETIRFNTVEQAERAVLVTGASNNTPANSTNVVWLFDDVLANPIDTSGYFSTAAGSLYQVGRVWMNADLIAANGGNIESLFTTLPSTTLRVDFATLAELQAALENSVGFDRTIELASFVNTSASGLTFNDGEPLANIRELTVKLGGNANTGDINLDNLLAVGANPIAFNGVIIESWQATDGTTVFNQALLPEGFVLGTHVPPNATNTVGNITSTSELPLTSVTLNTGTAAGQAVLNVGTITYTTNTPAAAIATLNAQGNQAINVVGVDLTAAAVNQLNIAGAGTGELNVSGQIVFGSTNPLITTGVLNVDRAATTQIKGIELQDNVTSFTLTNNGAGAVNVTGGSPALNAAQLTQLNLNAAAGDIALGGALDVNDPDSNFFGIVAPQLTNLTTSGASDVNVVLDAVNANAFVYTHGAGNGSSVTLDNVAIGAAGEWTFNLDGAAGNGATLVLTSAADFSAGGVINVAAGNDGAISVAGHVDLRDANFNVTGTAVAVTVQANGSLTLRAEDLDTLNTAPVSANFDKQGVGADQGFVKIFGQDALNELTLTHADKLELTGAASIDFDQLAEFYNDAVDVQAFGDALVKAGYEITLRIDGDNAALEGAVAAPEATNIQNIINAADVLYLEASANLDLTSYDIAHIRQLVLEDGAEVTLTQAQVDQLQAQDSILVVADGGPAPVLNVTELGEDAFDVSGIVGLALGDVTVKAGTTTLHENTTLVADAGNADQVLVLNNSTLTLTQAQLNQILGAAGVKITNADGVPVNTRVNITELGADGANPVAFDATQIVVQNAGTITLATAVATIVMAAAADLGNFSVVYGMDAQHLTLSSYAQANGRDVTGLDDATLLLAFVADVTGTIDASGYSNIEALRLLEALVDLFIPAGLDPASPVDEVNIETILQGLAGATEVKVYVEPVTPPPGGSLTDPTAVNVYNRTFTLEAGSTVNGTVIVNQIDPDNLGEVRNLTLNLEGDATITGGLSLPTTAPGAGSTQQYLNTLTINSTGALANSITGNITAGAEGAASENNLLNVVINASQDISIGQIHFSYVENSAPLNAAVPNATATATLRITGDADVTIDKLIAVDPHVTGFVLDTTGYTGNLNILGGSAAFGGAGAGDETTYEITLIGDGNVTFGGGDDGLGGVHPGFNAGALTKIDASGFNGALDLGRIDNVAPNFELITGTANVTVELASDLNDTSYNLGFDQAWQNFQAVRAQYHEVYTNRTDDGAGGNSHAEVPAALQTALVDAYALLAAYVNAATAGTLAEVADLPAADTTAEAVYDLVVNDIQNEVNDALGSIGSFQEAAAAYTAALAAYNADTANAVLQGDLVAAYEALQALAYLDEDGDNVFALELDGDAEANAAAIAGAAAATATAIAANQPTWNLNLGANTTLILDTSTLAAGSKIVLTGSGTVQVPENTVVDWSQVDLTVGPNIRFDVDWENGGRLLLSSAQTNALQDTEFQYQHFVVTYTLAEAMDLSYDSDNDVMLGGITTVGRGAIITLPNNASTNSILTGDPVPLLIEASSLEFRFSENQVNTLRLAATTEIDVNTLIISGGTVDATLVPVNDFTVGGAGTGGIVLNSSLILTAAQFAVLQAAEIVFTSTTDTPSTVVVDGVTYVVTSNPNDKVGNAGGLEAPMSYNVAAALIVDPLATNYVIVDSAAHLLAQIENPIITGAISITANDSPAASLSVEEAEALLEAGVIFTSGYNILDTAEAILAVLGDAVITGAEEVIVEANAELSVAEATSLVNAGVSLEDGYVLVDTVANLNNAPAALFNGADGRKVVDTAANIEAVSNPYTLLANADAITAQTADEPPVAEALTLNVAQAEAFADKVDGDYSIVDTAAAITTAIAGSDDLSGAETITHTDTQAAGAPGATGTTDVVDIFVFALGGDVDIHNFELGTDRIDVSAFINEDAVFEVLTNGGGAGPVQIFVSEDTDTTIAFDINDDGNANFTITLVGIGVAGSINATSFIFGEVAP